MNSLSAALLPETFPLRHLHGESLLGDGAVGLGGDLLDASVGVAPNVERVRGLVSNGAEHGEGETAAQESLPEHIDLPSLSFQSLDTLESQRHAEMLKAAEKIDDTDKVLGVSLGQVYTADTGSETKQTVVEQDAAEQAAAKNSRRSAEKSPPRSAAGFFELPRPPEDEAMTDGIQKLGTDAAQFCFAVHGSAARSLVRACAPPEATGRDSGVDGSRGTPEEFQQEAHKDLPAANLRTEKGAQGARRAGTHDQQAAGLLGPGPRAAGGDRVPKPASLRARAADAELAERATECIRGDDAAQFCFAVHGSAARSLVRTCAPPEATGQDSGVDGSRGTPEEAHKVLPAANLRTGKGAQGARRAGTHDQQAAGLLGPGSRAAGGDRVCFELAAAAEPAESEETRLCEQAEPIKTAKTAGEAASCAEHSRRDAENAGQEDRCYMCGDMIPITRSLYLKSVDDFIGIDDSGMCERYRRLMQRARRRPDCSILGAASAIAWACVHGSAKDALVLLIKNLQRCGWSQKWRNFCVAHGYGAFDPCYHEAIVLKSFVMSVQREVYREPRRSRPARRSTRLVSQVTSLSSDTIPYLVDS